MYKTLIKFTIGEYSFKDYLKVKSWINLSEEDGATRKIFFRHWLDSLKNDAEETRSLDHVFERVKNKLPLTENKISRKRRVWKFYRQAAAILLIPLLSFTFWYSFNENPITTSTPQPITVFAPEGSRVHFTLPDNSTGWLNGGSKLQYSPQFGTSRKVSLIGEAFFEVRQNKESEFIVNSGSIDITVLGTKFNVSAYPEDSYTDVVLMEGKVKVTNKIGQYEAALMPNHKFRFNHTSHKNTITSVNAERHSAWTKGFLIIDSEPLETVVAKLERRYNAEINIEDDFLKTYRFKATFRDEPLEEVLRLISITTPIEYDIENRISNSNGMLKQKNVSIRSTIKE